MSNEAVVKLPPMGHIRLTIRSQREENVAPNIPQVHRDKPVIPNDYGITTHGDRFLLHDGGPGDTSRMKKFATEL